MKHTPGPWWITKSWFGRGRYRVFAEGGLGAFPVASSIYYESDARAIQALPEMHAALAAMFAEASAKGVVLQSMPNAAKVLAKIDTDAGRT